MPRRALSPGAFHSTPIRAEPQSRPAGEARRWRPGVSLTIALSVSLALWAALIAAALSLLGL